MANLKNEHVFQNKDGWMVRQEGSRKIPKLFENKKDAMEYAGIIALSAEGSIVVHRHNGQFKNFKYGDKIYVMTNEISKLVNAFLIFQKIYFAKSE